jgi:hypothetical protein
VDSELERVLALYSPFCNADLGKFGEEKFLTKILTIFKFTQAFLHFLGLRKVTFFKSKLN